MNTKKADLSYEQHLVINECSVSPGGEWMPRSSGWTVIQVQKGVGYWLQSKSSTDIETGTLLLVAAGVPGRIRASQLNGLSLSCFNVIPGCLTGLTTFGEREFLATASQLGVGVRVLPPDHPTALKMTELRDSPGRNGSFFRLTLLKLFLEALGTGFEQVAARRGNAGASERLRAFLDETPPATLLETSFRDLAQIMHCTPRHLSRVFNEIVGMSYRDKRTEIQLARARDLLANSDSKIVDVALESGYRSLSLFNMMFARRFGTSPGRWRQKNAANRGRKTSENARGQLWIHQNGKRPVVEVEMRAGS